MSELSATPVGGILDSNAKLQTVTQPRELTIEDLLAANAKRLVKRSKDLQNKIETAKTKAKKEYYLKKLRKNNKELANALVRLDHVKKKGTQ